MTDEAKLPADSSETSDAAQEPSKPAAGKAAKPKTAKAAEAAGEQLYEITLHDNLEVPPNGQFIGVNGKQYLLKPGVRTKVPASVLGVLDNAVHTVPERDDDHRIVAWRSAPRLTYTLHRD